MARADELSCGTEQSERIDAGVEPEAPVLDRDQQGGQQGWLCLGAEAPDAAGSGEEGEGVVVSVEDLGADSGEAGEIGREGAVEGDTGGGQEPEQGGEEGQELGDAPPPLPSPAQAPERGRNTPSPALTRGRVGEGVCRHSDPTIVIRPAA